MNFLSIVYAMDPPSSGGESLEIHPIMAFLPLFVMLFLLIPGIIWARKKSKNSSFEIPMSWYYFYTYVRLPLTGIFMVLITLDLFLEPQYQSVSRATILTFVMFNSIFFIMLIALFIGLSKFKSWAWYLNIVVIFLDCLLGSFRNFDNNLIMWIMQLIAGLFIWFLPNFIYFNKRKNLFVKK